MNSVEARQNLVHALNVDLVGPLNDSSLAEEVLDQVPSRWYLTGFLVPLDASEEQRSEETSAEEALELEGGSATDDATVPEPAAARRAYMPSSMGLSLMASGEKQTWNVIVRWGDYKRAEVTGEGGQTEQRWSRIPKEQKVTLELPDKTDKPKKFDVPGSNGLKIVISVRQVNADAIPGNLMPSGTRSASVFLVNERRPRPDDVKDEGFAFQAELEVSSDHPLVPRPNLRGLESNDRDERIADLQYRDAFEYAVGHGVAIRATVEGGNCSQVNTCWIPTAEVQRVAPSDIPGVELQMEALASLKDGVEAKAKLGSIVTQFRDWLKEQRKNAPATPARRKEVAEFLHTRASVAGNRIEAGIKLLEDPQVLEAFRIANRTMAAAGRRRAGIYEKKDSKTVSAPKWRPFQIAFLLMNLPGIANPNDPERETVDLLFFPTGGGKTEAYLGLAAFTLVLRRLQNPGLSSAGLSVLMRYTLRLLTLDQLSRAATLICALELERQQDAEKLGDWPFEIGLWVGQTATPNNMGKRGDTSQYTARARTIAFLNDDRKPSPIPLENCPWCGAKFTRNSFQLVPNPDNPKDLRVRCVDRRCDFSSKQPLPILAVDEPIYRRLPCFLIATVDKFAALPWTGEVGSFFGKVERADKNGFYGSCEPGTGTPLPKPLLPPDLIIQDELHLISGPMGTMVGLYESAIDALCTRIENNKTIRPKIVASTATVRRAENQIKALFNRNTVDVFPPPGPDRHDSFFAKTHSTSESNARLYVGIAAQGRSPKVMMLRTYLALLGAAKKSYGEDGGDKAVNNAADPYMTLLGYFNSLRELGGCRRIVEDEVGTRVSGYAGRKRVGEKSGLFANRKISYEVLELTSRVSTNKVSDAKRRLALPFHEKEHVDVALATNMISVGLDITRLGLMVVFGQPKTSAEYIQATSRVGRETSKPGLVITLLNIHKPRDRSHYERFLGYHQSFYRSVEATSVTPFSPRALDRGLAGTAIALTRHGHKPMTAPKGAMEILKELGKLNFVVDALTARAQSHMQMTKEEQEKLRDRVNARVKDLLDEWCKIADETKNVSGLLQYQTEVGGAQRLLYEFLHPELKKLPKRHMKFRANRSMRDVESSVNLWLRTLDNTEVPAEVEE